MSVKQARAVLVGNAKHITKTSGGDQQRGFAFALKQGVGRHSGAHAYTGNALSRYGFMGLQAQQLAYPLHRGIRVHLRVLAQQFVGVQFPPRISCHDVREGAATVNPKLPALISLINLHVEN